MAGKVARLAGRIKVRSLMTNYFLIAGWKQGCIASNAAGHLRILPSLPICLCKSECPDQELVPSLRHMSGSGLETVTNSFIVG